MTKLIPKKQTAWGKLEYNGPQYYELKENIKKEDPALYNKLELEYAALQHPTSEFIMWKDSNDLIRRTPQVIGMSGADPIGLLYVEGVALNPVFKGLGKVAEYGLAKTGNNWARARILSREMLNISTPNKTIPNNVGWAPKLTVLVSHASNENILPNLYFEKRWDVVNEGANPHGIWYQGKLGIPRTDLTNPGKGTKALKARDLFSNRPYLFKGEVTFEKPMQTIGDVKNRSQLSYDADNMGADGLIYNDIYDNGYNHNLVILGWKLFNSPNIKLSIDSYDFFDESNPLNLSPISVKKFFKNDVEKRTHILENSTFIPDNDDWYKYELYDFKNGILGDYTPEIDRVRISRTLDPLTSHTTKIHEFRHKLESRYPLNYYQRNYLDRAYRIFSTREPRYEASRSLSEKTATNTELRASLYHKFRQLNGREPRDLREMDRFIDGLDKKELRNALRQINGYGSDYVESILSRIEAAKLEGLPRETIQNGVNQWVENIKQALKYVPVLSGVSLIPKKQKLPTL